MNFVSKTFIAIAAAAVLAGGYSSPSLSQERSQISNDRAKLMRAMGGALRGIGGAADAAAAVGPAKVIAENSKALETMWAQGSGGPNSRAKDEIWASMGEFTGILARLQNAGAQMVSAAEGGNLDGVKAAFGAARGTCGACHKAFRGPKLKE